MSQENVELVRAVFKAWNAGDMDAVRDACDPKIIVRSPEGWPESGPFFGRDAVMRAFEQLRETFDSDWQELVSDLAHVGDRVAVRTVWHGVGYGPELKQESTPIFTVRRGRVFEIEFFSDHAEALEAVGSTEQATSRGNVELARAYFDEIAGTSRESLDPEVTISRMAEFWDPEIEWDTSDGIALDISQVYEGKEGAREWCREWFTAWEALQFEYELVDAGDRVVVLIDLRMRGRSTGIEVALGKHAWVITFRDGLMVRSKLYMSQSQALQAVGRSE